MTKANVSLRTVQAAKNLVQETCASLRDAITELRNHLASLDEDWQDEKRVRLEEITEECIDSLNRTIHRYEECGEKLQEIEATIVEYESVRLAGIEGDTPEAAHVSGVTANEGFFGEVPTEGGGARDGWRRSRVGTTINVPVNRHRRSPGGMRTRGVLRNADGDAIIRVPVNRGSLLQSAIYHRGEPPDAPEAVRNEDHATPVSTRGGRDNGDEGVVPTANADGESGDSGSSGRGSGSSGRLRDPEGVLSGSSHWPIPFRRINPLSIDDCIRVANRDRLGIREKRRELQRIQNEWVDEARANGDSRRGMDLRDRWRACLGELECERVRYTRNCQRCIAAYDLLRRGYAVKAKPRLLDLGGDPSSSDELASRSSANGFLHLWENGNLVSCGNRDGIDSRRFIERQMASWGPPARAIVGVRWSRGGGHLFIVEQEGEATRFVDPQTDNDDCSDYFHDVIPGETFFMRIDNLEPARLMLEAVEEA